MRMRCVTPMKIAKLGYIAMSALLCALGILLIAYPAFSAAALGTVCGILVVVFGVVKLVGYFSKDLYRLAFQYDLAFGLLLITLGVVMLVHPVNPMNFICIALGVFIMADGLFKIQIAFEAKKFGLASWWSILIPAVIAAAFGIVMIFRPDVSSAALTVLLGITILAEGILSFGTVITAVKIVKNQRPDVIRTDDFEERED